VDGADISAAALAVARITSSGHGLGVRVRLVQSDCIRGLAGRRYDLILTNPPYVGCHRHGRTPRTSTATNRPSRSLPASRASTPSAHSGARPGTPLNPGGALIAEVGNSHFALAERFPEGAFVWLTSASGDESVFLLSAAELGPPCRAAFASALRPA